MRRRRSAPAPDESAAVPGRAKTARIIIMMMSLLNIAELCGFLLIPSSFLAAQAGRLN
jgi:hypothetical protein